MCCVEELNKKGGYFFEKAGCAGCDFVKKIEQEGGGISLRKAGVMC